MHGIVCAQSSDEAWMPHLKRSAHNALIRDLYRSVPPFAPAFLPAQSTLA